MSWVNSLFHFVKQVIMFIGLGGIVGDLSGWAGWLAMLYDYLPNWINGSWMVVSALILFFTPNWWGYIARKTGIRNKKPAELENPESTTPTEEEPIKDEVTSDGLQVTDLIIEHRLNPKKVLNIYDEFMAIRHRCAERWVQKAVFYVLREAGDQKRVDTFYEATPNLKIDKKPYDVEFDVEFACYVCDKIDIEKLENR